MAADDLKITYRELTPERIDALLAAGDSFEVVAVLNQGEAVNLVEGRIEKVGLTCRVYTEFRSASLGALFSPAVFAGLAAGVAIAAHNLATLNPDYEIGKNKVAGTVTVTCKDREKVRRHFAERAATASQPTHGFEGAMHSLSKGFFGKGK